MFRRTMDAAFFNVVANDPEVRPWLGGGAAQLDLTPVLANPANIGLIAEHGGWILTRHEPSVYELHTLFLKEGRGAPMFEAGEAALRYLFTATDCQEIVTKVPLSNCGAVMWARKCGLVERFRRIEAWINPDGSKADISYQALSIDRWSSRNETLITEGEWFHRQFEAYGLPAHPEDLAHDRAVGAAVLMAKAGLHRKSVWFYNRWARLAGYPIATLLNEAPVTIDMSVPGLQCVVQVRDGQMEVLICRSV